MCILHILSPEDWRPSLRGDLLLVDSETGQELPVSIDENYIDVYEEQVRAWTDPQQQCQRLGASYTLLSTDDAVETILFSRSTSARGAGPMSFLTPLGLLLGGLAIPLTALYFVRLRRRRVQVPSLLLWHASKRSRQLRHRFNVFVVTGCTGSSCSAFFYSPLC